ncbi:hypothetical protein [Actinoplanes sp. NPDC049265]|uniref:hypothetical protein n=1 Tax=Actinoplanes sp. NPDC049265 TaxID=3363902 RepID=UPI00371BBEA7
MPVSCDYCPDGHTASFHETIRNGLLHWLLTYDCPRGWTESIGWHRSPEPFRQAVLAQEGTYRLELPDGAGSHRVAFLKALRDGGVPRSALDRVAGTRTEMELLAARVTAATPVRCEVTRAG